MGNKLFVGNLSFNTADDDLRRHFETAGEVISAQVVLDRDTRRSRGFGFVEMADAAGSAEAGKLDGSNLDGRTLRVNPADEKPQRSGGGSRGGGYRSGGGNRRY